VSHLFGISDWTASGPLPAETVCNEAAAALIWIKASENRQRPVLAQGLGRQDLACWTWAAGLGLLDSGCWTWLSPRIHCSKIPVAGETS
jgi:hypothetical protein